MSNEQLEISDPLYRYLCSVSDREFDILKELRAETVNHPNAIMQLTPMGGQFLQVLIMATRARRVLEVGCFTGYSSTAMGMVLPEDGELITCDVSEEWTAIARRFWQKAKIDHKIKLKLAPSSETLESLIADEESDSFDMAFLDGDKSEYWNDWNLVLKLLRPGGLIVVDNTLFKGAVISDEVAESSFANQDDQSRRRMVENAKAIHAFNAKIESDSRVHMVLLPVADGMTLAAKK